VPDLFYHPEQLAALARLVVILAGQSDAGGETGPAGAIGAAAFRDASGLGRKRAIQVLEFFDRVGYTRRIGDAHLLRPNAVWA
jgi:selenocysteine-specific elongation factor